MEFWQLGNTTVRSGMRLKDGVAAFVEAGMTDGGIRGEEGDIRCRNALGRAGIVKLGTDKTNSVGRKWRAAMGKLGFLYPEVKNKWGFQQSELGIMDGVTPSGYALVKADTVPAIQDCFLRAMSVPTLETERGTLFAPLIWVLNILLELEKKSGKPCISFFEMAAVVQVTNPDDGIDEVVSRILELRILRANAASKRRFDKQYFEKESGDMGCNPHTFKDYADMNIRYLKASGLVQAYGKGIALVPEKHELAESLTQVDSSQMTRLELYRELCNGAHLPTDNAEIALKVLKNQLSQAKQMGLLVDVDWASLNTAREINAARYRIEEQISGKKEEIFAHEQASQWEEIAKYMGMLEKNKDKLVLDEENEVELRIPRDERPAYLEWILWRAFLAIDTLVNKPYEVRSFKIDQDFLPVGTAPGNRPDLIAEFRNFVIVIEVTLSESSRQEAMEGEPVRRHVADAVEKYSKQGKPVFGLFIAKNIDSNTAETFRIGVWYNKEDKKLELNIIPFTIAQFKNIFEYLFRSGTASPDQMLRIMTICQKDRTLDAPLWKNSINSRVEILTKEIINNYEV
ncbi:AlwI family type II restriction endonuclease [Bifidobacterium pseudocatenulatum]|uniref:AlwI family type II restriction endonuclease n=1 Tax=Bifidobacterium pseudocatenulatum TaxID=28026 RepID=UPI0022E6A5FA|nr:AlwI family type II restriction endonuclease [Bifidobacterium pseudocatenulatum]